MNRLHDGLTAAPWGVVGSTAGHGWNLGGGKWPVRVNTAATDGPASCALCAGANPAQVTPLAELLQPGQSRFVAATPGFVAVPTYGCFVAGYLLIVPRAHVLSFGRLDAVALAEAEELIGELTDRLRAAYGLRVLGFEYGINTAGVRRVEHAHWHLLPSEADLTGWLDDYLTGTPIASLSGLPCSDGSYIAVRDQDETLTVYDVPAAAEMHQRIRLRLTVAALDPRVDDAAWDWADHQYVELIRATVSDLGAGLSADGSAS